MKPGDRVLFIGDCEEFIADGLVRDKTYVVKRCGCGIRGCEYLKLVGERVLIGPPEFNEFKPSHKEFEDKLDGLLKD